MKKKNKFDVIKDLKSCGYYHKFFFEKPPKEIEAKLIKFYFDDDIYQNKENVKNILGIENPTNISKPFLLAFDCNHEIVSMVTLTERYQDSKTGLNFYSLGLYIRKNHRTRGLKNRLLLMQSTCTLAYFESYEHLQSTNNENNVVGLSYHLGNEKLFKTYFKKRTYIDDEYPLFFYLGDSTYVMYYPNTFIA